MVVFFPIRNPDGDDLPIEPQTMYVMFSMDRLTAQLQQKSGATVISTPLMVGFRYCQRDNWMPFSERVQAFTVQPNPRRVGDGSTVNGTGWWWRQDYIKIQFVDKEGYFDRVQFPINQGELELLSDFILLLPTAVPI